MLLCHREIFWVLLASVGLMYIQLASKKAGTQPFSLWICLFMILHNQCSNCPCSNYDLFSKTTFFHYLASSYHHTPYAHHLICPCSWYNWMIYHVLTFFPRNILWDMRKTGNPAHITIHRSKWLHLNIRWFPSQKFLHLWLLLKSGVLEDQSI